MSHEVQMSAKPNDAKQMTAEGQMTHAVLMTAKPNDTKEISFINYNHLSDEINYVNCVT